MALTLVPPEPPVPDGEWSPDFKSEPRPGSVVLGDMPDWLSEPPDVPDDGPPDERWAGTPDPEPLGPELAIGLPAAQRARLPVKHQPTPSTPTDIAPPHSLDAEREVLSAVLVRPEAIDLMLEHVQPGDFYYERHQIIARAYVSLFQAKTAIDIVTVAQRLIDTGKFELIGGPRALNELLDRVGTVEHLPHYCKIVRQKARQRGMVDTAKRIERIGLSDLGTTEVDQYIQRSELDVAEAATITGVGEKSWSDWTLACLEEATIPQPTRHLLPTGIGPLDQWLGGGLDGGLTYAFMCDPGVGKTSFALGNVAVTTCKNDLGVVYFSCEMGPRRLSQRLISGESGVPPRAFKARDFVADQVAKIYEAGEMIAGWGLAVLKMSPIEVIMAQLRRFKRNGVPYGKIKGNARPLRLVVIDYYQRIPHGEKSAVEGLTNAIHILQEGIGELDVPCIILSQPSTDSRRTKKVQTGADSKGSGALEEDCDLFGILERGGPERNLAGLRVTKARDFDGTLPHWAVEDVRDKSGKMIAEACNWKWKRARIMAPGDSVW